MSSHFEGNDHSQTYTPDLQWLKMDERFRKAIVKSSVEECERGYSHDPILDFKEPK
jgi:hypothetical protein